MTRDSGWIYFNAGNEEHYDKIASSTLGVDACIITEIKQQRWCFIPWTAIRKILYDVD